jgi:hypothetical protein
MANIIIPTILIVLLGICIYGAIDVIRQINKLD